MNRVDIAAQILAHNWPEVLAKQALDAADELLIQAGHSPNGVLPDGYKIAHGNTGYIARVGDERLGPVSTSEHATRLAWRHWGLKQFRPYNPPVKRLVIEGPQGSGKTILADGFATPSTFVWDEEAPIRTKAAADHPVFILTTQDPEVAQRYLGWFPDALHLKLGSRA